MAEAERAKVLRTFLLTRVDEFRFPENEFPQIDTRTGDPSTFFVLYISRTCSPRTFLPNHASQAFVGVPLLKFISKTFSGTRLLATALGPRSKLLQLGGLDLILGLGVGLLDSWIA